MQGMKEKTCKIAMPYEIIDFRNIVVKFFFRNELENVTDVKNEENTDHVNEKISENFEKIFEKIFQFQSEKETAFQNSPEISIKRDRDRSKKLSLRYRNTEADISIFFQSENSQNELLMQHMQVSISASISASFVESRKKEINDLFEKGCFEIISTFDVFHETRIFNSRFVDEIKNIGTIDAYEKSRLVVQAYNDDDKTKMLTQAPTIQRMSQRLILTLTASMSHLNLYLRDISQIYVQSIISLARKFFIRSFVELGFEDAILKIIKSFYEVSEAEAH